MSEPADTSPATPENPECLVLVCAVGEPSTPVGCGFALEVAGELCVLTCAHAVNASLGRGPRVAELPSSEIPLVPWRARQRSFPGRVERSGDWHPIADDGSGDTALLRLAGTVPLLKPAPVGRWDERRDREFQCLGFPQGYKEQGQHAIGRTIGRCGPSGAWVQLDGQSPLGFRVITGYSGTPVWDRLDRTVIGMILGEDREGADTRVAVMSPIETVADEVAGITVVPAPSHATAHLRQLRPDGRGPPTVADVDGTLAGVTPTRYDAVDGGSIYVERAMDALVGASLRTSDLVIVQGPSTAGKSRTALEAARRELPGFLFVDPRGRESVRPLLYDDELGLADFDVLVWLDDLERFLEDEMGVGLADDFVARTALRRGRWVLLGTLRDRERRAMRQSAELRSVRAIERLETSPRTSVVRVPLELDGDELDRARDAYRDESFQTGSGIGEVLIAGRALLDKLRSDECSLGSLLVQIVVDWQRAGREDPILETALIALANESVRARAEREPDADAVDAALAWALSPLVSQVALITRVDVDGSPGYRALDYIADALDPDDAPAPIPTALWTLASATNDRAVYAAVLGRAHARRDEPGKLAVLNDIPHGFSAEDRALFDVVHGGALIAVGRPADGATFLMAALQHGSDVTRAHAFSSLGDAFIAMERDDDAERAYRAGFRSGHDHTVDQCLSSLRELYTRLGDDAALEAILLEGTELQDRDTAANAFMNLSALYDRQGRKEQAAMAMEAYARLSTQPLHGLVRWASQLYTEAGLDEDAVRVYDHALGTDTPTAEERVDLLFHRGWLRSKLGRNDDAERDYRAALEIGAGEMADAAAVNLAGLLAHDAAEERDELLGRATQSHNAEFAGKAWLVVARTRADSDDLAGAADALHRCVALLGDELEPDDALALGYVYSACGDDAAAEAAYGRAETVERPERHSEIRVVRARLLVHLGRVNEATALLHALGTDARPEPAQAAWLELGRVLSSGGAHDEALHAFHQGLAIPGPHAPRLRAELALAIRDADAAIALLQEDRDHPDPTARAHANELLGLTLRELGRDEEARTAFEATTSTGHEHSVAHAWYELGLLEQRSEVAAARRRAIECFEHAWETESQPWSGRAALQCAGMLIDDGEQARADQLLAAVADDDLSDRMRRLLGSLLVRQGAPHRARRHLEAALAGAEASGDTVLIGEAGLALAGVLRDLGLADQRRRILDRVAGSAGPASAGQAGLLLGGHYMGLGELTQARRHLEEVTNLEVYGSSPDAWLALVDLARLEGDRPAGEVALSRARELSPDHPKVLLAEAVHLLEDGDVDEAARRLESCVGSDDAEVAGAADYDLVHVEIARDDNDAADARLERLTTTGVEPYSHLAILLLARRHADAGRIDEALRLSQSLIDAKKRCEHTDQSHLLYAEILSTAGRDAYAAYERAARVPNMAIRLQAESEISEMDPAVVDRVAAQRRLQAVLASPDPFYRCWAAALLAEYALDDGRFGDPVRFVDIALESDHEALRSYVGLIVGRLRLTQGRLEDARLALLDLADDPDEDLRDRASLLLAEISEAAGDHGDAIVGYRRVLTSQDNRVAKRAEEALDRLA